MKNPFALNKNNEIVYISKDISKDNSYYANCHCPVCNEKLIAKMGKVNIWHFSHKINTKCEGNFETSLHLYAKKIIRENNKINLPSISLYDYFNMHKENADKFINLLKSPYCNYHEVINDNGNVEIIYIFNSNFYNYKWIGNERKIDNFIPDCLVEIKGKNVGIEILVTHKVDTDKQKKVIRKNFDMIEIDLSLLRNIIEENKKVDIREYILNDLESKRWIYKTRNEKLENRFMPQIEKVVNEGNELALKKQKKQEKIQYCRDNEVQIKNSNIKHIIKIIDNYSKMVQNDEIKINNIQVNGEYAFDCFRTVWQTRILDKFIKNREGKYIQLAKINSYFENYQTDIRYFKYFNKYNGAKEIWNSKKEAIQNYLLRLCRIGFFPGREIDDSIGFYKEIQIGNYDINKISSELKEVYKDDFYHKERICKQCGEIFKEDDRINYYYLFNFGLDKECFEEYLKNEMIQ